LPFLPESWDSPGVGDYVMVPSEPGRGIIVELGITVAKLKAYFDKGQYSWALLDDIEPDVDWEDFYEQREE
jgi:hypothetical protein